MSAQAQLRRLLHLLPALADDEDHSLSEMAEILGVDRKTLLADFRTLLERKEDLPGHVDGISIWLDGDQFSVHSSHFLRPMRLTRAEVLALDLGLAMLRSETPPDEQAGIESARERLDQILARLPEDSDTPADRHAEIAAPVPSPLLATVREAARDRRKLRLGYQRADQTEPDVRTVCPYSLVFTRGMWYLVAHCSRSDGIRIFRCDRVRSAEPEQENFTVPDDYSLRPIVQEGRAFLDQGTGRLRVRYSPQVARWIAEREGREPGEDGWLTLEHPLADFDWAVRHVLQYGPDAEILDPPEARDAVRQRLQQLLAEAG